MITIDPIKRPPKKSSSVDTTEIMKEVDLKFADFIGEAPEKLDTIKELAEAVASIPDLDIFVTKEEINNISAGIPLVEELDPDASLGTLVRYKQTVTITKEETITKTGSIRDLNQNLGWDFNSSVNTEGLDTISDINFMIPSNLPDEGSDCGFILYSNNVLLGISIGCYNNLYEVTAFNFINNENFVILDSLTGINDDSINFLKNQLSSEIYYLGSGISDEPLTEELFDLIDLFFTFTLEETIKTTEEITKVVPYIKQLHIWESIITENSDFNFDPTNYYAKSEVDAKILELQTLINNYIDKNTPEESTSPNLVCVYNVTDTSQSTSLLYGYALKYITKMIVDGVEMDVETYYQFDTEGLHTIEYILDDNTALPDQFFQNNKTLISIEIPNTVSTISGLFISYGLDNLLEIIFHSPICPTITDSSYFGDSASKSSVIKYPKGADYSELINKLPEGWTTVEF